MTTEKVDAWMPLWIGAYLADTMHLSRDSHGGYLLLLFAYWRNKGPLLDDDEELASITKATPAEWRKLRPRLVRFFTVADGHWHHGRADKELNRAGLHKATAVAKAKAGAEARWKKAREQAAGNAPSMPEALPGAVPKQCPTPSPNAEAIASDGADAPAAGEGQLPEPPEPPAPPAPPAPPDGKAALWRESLEVLLAGGVKTEDTARSFMGKLVKDFDLAVVREAVTAAICAQPADAREYLKATCQRLKGERRDPITVPSTDTRADEFKVAMEQRAKEATKPPAEVLAMRRRTA